MARHASVVRTLIGLAVTALLCAPAGAADTGAVPTFSKDVSPIFRAKCETCHRPGSIGPMSLVTYQDARPWARAIGNRVALRQMPPWHIDRNVGIQSFKNDASLTDAQIGTIVRWAAGGAPQGDPKDMPPAITWPDKPQWNFASLFGQTEPDLIVTGPAYTMPSKAQDHWWSAVVPTGLTTPRWVRAIEMRPSTNKGRRITHHATARLIQDDPSQPQGGQGALPGVGGYFMEWAVGKQGELMRPNAGRLMMPGAKIFFDVHYNSADEAITDAIQLGVYFYPIGQEPKYRQVLTWFDAFQRGKETLDIRPSQLNVHQGFHVLKSAARVESFQPHMHWRGKAMTMEAILPDGTREVLSHVNDYSFNWHINYTYTDNAAPLLPRGTIVHITAWHDNTAAHRSNPDPTQWVTWGDRTVDEMAHAWTGVTYLSDAEYEQELADRKAKQVSQR